MELELLNFTRKQKQGVILTKITNSNSIKISLIKCKNNSVVQND